MRKLMKFLHTLGAIGLVGAVACFLVMAGYAPAPSAITQYAPLSIATGAVATWIFMPSLGLTLVAGLLAMAVNRAFHNAGWAWAKLAMGVLVFEWGFVSVVGPLQQEAEQSARALAGGSDPATLAGELGTRSATLWVFLAIAMANIVLGVWRPRLTRLPD
ncbi:hypothetical protein JQ621_13450 [Bradyrhizobium manausense]|uniref:hypothetical protein n=1 Tax=Bradyrhizobium manausense TaxID=989370 RepID=UPI001BADFA38|nr:hypothetical protein [Bradyrhizobium manausense]MBR1088470.1 hypothetical protein [Bradyrhizobium manausense]